MSENQLSLGQAIDTMIKSMEGLNEVSRKTALLAVCGHLNINIGNIHSDPQKVFPATIPPEQQQKVNLGSSIKMADIRSLKDEKQPGSARDMACIVAYYLSEIATGDDKKETVNTDDLRKYFKQARFRLPNRIEQLLKDAKNSGYFDVASRGEYKLNAVGYNLVAHQLPQKKA